ncbi:hypothetical protein V5799_016095 [Amblyomma americanum]|uniref:DDE Tnp4 domain-containing protein n=1 Tax=Amblyomma americanum TaxID=6943 RepID=A0AAQ4F603_AMBAM
MPDDLFRQHFRLTKDLVRWLCDELREDLERQRVNTATVLTVEQQVLCALRFYATGSFQGMIASDEHLAVSQPSVSRCIHAVTDAIVNCLGHEWISFPCSPAELATAREGFELLDSRFPGCVGAIDGTLVCIAAPSDEVNRPAYFCRKGYYALNVMVVCDAHLRIRALDATFPGSVHDSFVWRTSPVHHALCNHNFLQCGEYLLGM